MMRRSRILWTSAATLAALCGCAVAALAPSRCDSLLHGDRVFEFRDVVLSMKAPSPFYRGVLAYVFHDWPRAERELLAVARSTPWWSRQGYSAADLLENIYAMSGRNTDARAQFDALGWHNIFWNRAKFLARGSRGDFAVAQRAYSRIPYATVDNQIFIPVSIDGKPANYQIDTGCSESYLSDSEARRLGLAVDPYISKIQGYSRMQQVTGIAVASEMAIGNFRLRNVPFLVQPDKEMGSDAGLIGLPVLLALETLRWGPDGILEIGFPGRTPDLREANLAFAGVTLLTKAGFGNDSLDLQLDTGADTTRLYPRFRRQYLDFLRLFGHLEPVEIASGRIDRLASTVPEVRVMAGSSERTLQPARVLSQNPSPDTDHWHGSVGFDFLSESGTVTLDFHAMQISLAGDGLIAHNRADGVSCDLPHQMVCPKGWTCTVKPTNDGCQLDRLLDTPWPGNRIGEHRNAPDSGYILDPGFQLPKDHNQTVNFELERHVPGAKK